MRFIRLVLLLAGALVLTACEVDLTVDLTVREDGSGTVTVEAVLDAEAVGALGDVQNRLQIDDLERAGWEIGGVEAVGDGARIVFSKPVAHPDQWQPVLDEIAGPGVFTNVRFDSQSDFAELQNRLRMSVDLTDGFDLASDAGVAEQLGGESFGVPIESLTGGRSIGEIVDVTVRVSVSSGEDGRPVTAVYEPNFDIPLSVDVESMAESTTAGLLQWVSYALGALFVLAAILAVVGVVLFRRSDRLRRSRPERLTSRVPGEPAPAPDATLSEINESTDTVRLVVVEPLSVLFRQSESAETYLLPFVRHNGGKTRADSIGDAHEDVVIGRMDTEEFWRLCGVEGEADVVDEVFTRMRSLRGGADDFMAEMQRRRIPVAAVTNDAAAWSALCRDRGRLHTIWPWLVSGEVGAKKPNPGMFEILRRETGVAYEHCLYIDTDLDNLDTAKSLGMKTALFDPGEIDLPADVGHARVEDLAGFLTRR